MKGDCKQVFITPLRLYFLVYGLSLLFQALVMPAIMMLLDPTNTGRPSNPLAIPFKFSSYLFIYVFLHAFVALRVLPHYVWNKI